MTKVCITIDTEGDSANNPQSTFLGIEIVLPQLIKLFDKYSIKATLYVQEDEICQVGTIFQKKWESLLEQKHEIGYHAHGLISASEEKKSEIINKGIQSLNKMGFTPVSFRAGRYHFNKSLIKILENNHIKYDSSVVPGLQEIFNNGTVRCDHRGAPYKPYFPSYENHCLIGDANILEIPINRYPELPSDRWGGMLSGNSSHEEILFDYFYEIRKDRVIVIALHPWDGLALNLQKIVRQKKYGKLKRLIFEICKRTINPYRLTSKNYIDKFEALLKYISSKKRTKFVTIDEAGEKIITEI